LKPIGESKQMKQVDVAIIGGGPAGMAAAIELAAGGADPAVIDAYPQPGGHYFRQPPQEFSNISVATDSRQAEYASLMAALERLNVGVLSETAVWSIFPAEGALDGYTLHLHGPHPVRSIQARYLLLASGAYDRPMAFPGWHLPGVMTPGGVQMLMKGHGILPGKRILVGGSGPLLLAAAAGLAEAGAEVVAVLDVASMWAGFFKVPQAFWRQTDRLKEAWKYGSTLRRKRIPLLFRHAIFRALGETEVTAVAYGRVDARGRPLKHTEKVAEVDTICVALGFMPNLALSRYLGCEHIYDARLDTFYPQHASTMATSIPNVFVAGDITGVGGKDLSKLQGQVAGLNILGKLGYLPSPEVKKRTQALEPQLKRETRFIHMIRDRLQVRPGLFELIDDETIICRCEMVTAGQIKVAISDGAREIRGVKLRTRCGMGPCQGRYCEPHVAHMIAHLTQQPREAVGKMSVRPPLMPVLINDILQ
jgi:NADPH-dependent 2,4-dienoyl-CoA reductase/sulfur reductase-like enzyme